MIERGFKGDARLHATTVALAALLSACGGGGGAGAPAAPIAPPAPAALTISGTAATGAAMAAAAVQIKCAGGTGTATSSADGSYTASITGASLPCVLSATSGTTTLRSVAEAGSATSATVNITPLSEIITAKLAGGDASTLFATFDAAAQAKLTATGLADARVAVTAALKGTVDLTGVDPIKDPLVAATTGKAGNELDKKLDALGAALKAGGVSVTDVGTALVANPTAPAVVQGLLQPVATSCAALRSGTYFALDAYASVPVAKLKVDAAKLTVTNVANEVTQMAAVSGSACAYTAGDGALTAFVAKSGVIVVRYAVSASVSRLMLMVPEQVVPLSELAGTWNIVSYAAPAAGGTPVPGYSVQTLNAASLTTAGADCVGLKACEAWTPRATDIFAISPDGGYVQSDDQGSVRAFPVKTPAGQMAVFAVILDAKKLPLGMAVLSRQEALTLPTVDQVDTIWDLLATPAGAQAAVVVQTKIKSVDTVEQSYKRERPSDGRIDGFELNKPRNGMRYRAAGSNMGSSGQTISFSEMIATPLPGMGLTVYTSMTGGTPGQANFLGLSIAKP